MRVGSSRWDQSPWKKRQWASSFSDWGEAREHPGGGSHGGAGNGFSTRNPTASFQNWEGMTVCCSSHPCTEDLALADWSWPRCKYSPTRSIFEVTLSAKLSWTGEGVRTVGETTERISLWLEHSQERQSQEMNLAELPTSGLCRDFFSLIGSYKTLSILSLKLYNRCLLVIYFIYRSIYIWIQNS